MKNWCKLQTAALNDHRLLKLPSDAQLTYYKLLHVAAQCDALGLLIEDDGTPLDYDALGIYLRQDPKACEMNIAALMRTGMITLTESGAFHVTNYSSERDETAADRKREQRKRDSERDATNKNDESRRDSENVTDTSRRDIKNVTALEKEEDKEKEIEKKKKKEVFAQSANPPPSNRRGLFFAKIAEICKLPKDSKQHSKSINAAALWFEPKQIDPSRLDDFSEWWFKNDWRGQKGEHPQPGQIVSEWLKFESNVTAKQPTQTFKSKNYRRPQVETTDADRAADELAASQVRAQLAERRAARQQTEVQL